MVYTVLDCRRLSDIQPLNDSFTLHHVRQAESGPLEGLEGVEVGHIVLSCTWDLEESRRSSTTSTVTVRREKK